MSSASLLTDIAEIEHELDVAVRNHRTDKLVWMAQKDIPFLIKHLRKLEQELRPSFSEAVMENNTVIRKCSLGHKHAIYPLSWREEYLQVLRIVRMHCHMTTSQLGKIINTPTTRKCLSELVHFGLVSVIDRKKGERVYALTGEGYDFLQGSKAINTRVWPKGEKLPPECIDSEPKYVDQVAAEHPKSDRELHAEMAVAMPGVGR